MYFHHDTIENYYGDFDGNITELLGIHAWYLYKVATTGFSTNYISKYGLCCEFIKSNSDFC